MERLHEEKCDTYNRIRLNGLHKGYGTGGGYISSNRVGTLERWNESWSSRACTAVWSEGWGLYRVFVILGAETVSQWLKAHVGCGTLCV